MWVNILSTKNIDFVVPRTCIITIAKILQVLFKGFAGGQNLPTIFFNNDQIIVVLGIKDVQ